MKTTFRNIASKSIAYLMIGVMTLLIANKAVFYHGHQLRDGSIINHAHPYDRSDDTKPYKSHHHTQSEIVFFDSVHILFLVALLIIGLTGIGIRSIYPDGRVTTYLQDTIHPFTGRAPPSYH